LACANKISTEISKQQASQLGLFNSVLGHVGDGNFHQVVMYNPDNKMERQAVSDCVDGMMVRALEMEGTVSGEHGIGLGKKVTKLPPRTASLQLTDLSIAYRKSSVQPR
jgi:D-lactate dehydrogenase (cytochrome)